MMVPTHYSLMCVQSKDKIDDPAIGMLNFSESNLYAGYDLEGMNNHQA